MRHIAGWHRTHDKTYVLPDCRCDTLEQRMHPRWKR